MASLVAVKAYAITDAGGKGRWLCDGTYNTSERTFKIGSKRRPGLALNPASLGDTPVILEDASGKEIARGVFSTTTQIVLACA